MGLDKDTSKHPINDGGWAGPIFPDTFISKCVGWGTCAAPDGWWVASAYGPHQCLRLTPVFLVASSTTREDVVVFLCASAQSAGHPGITNLQEGQEGATIHALLLPTISMSMRTQGSGCVGCSMIQLLDRLRMRGWVDDLLPFHA